MEENIELYNGKVNIVLIGMEKKINLLVKENENLKESEKDLKNDNDKLKRDFNELFEKYNNLLFKYEF
jgi:FtsZ-binding cell division protein ZapB